MPIVKKLDLDTLESSVIEVRFSSTVPAEAIYGLIYSKLGGKYTNNTRHKILQIPHEIRDTDPTLKYQAWYSIFNDTITLNIGPKVIWFNCHNGYIGWPKYYKEIRDDITAISKIKIINKVERIGLRYVNYFEGFNIYDHLNKKVEILDKSYSLNKLAISTQLETGEFTSTLTINNPANRKKGDTESTGSLLDIDTFTEDKFEFDQKLLVNQIRKLHLEEKKLFSNIIDRKFLTTEYNAKYK